MAIQNSSKFRKTWKSPFWGLWSRLSFATYYTHWNQYYIGYIISKIWVSRSNHIDFGKGGSNSKFWIFGSIYWFFRNVITDIYAIQKCQSNAENFDSMSQKSNFIWIFFKNLKLSSFCPNLKHDPTSVSAFLQRTTATFSWAWDAKYPTFCTLSTLHRLMSYCNAFSTSAAPPTPRLKIQNPKILNN